MVVPWLLLAATLAFIYGRQAGLALRNYVNIGPVAVLCVQFIIAIYGGYFGGAVGIIMMAAWSLMSEANLKVMGRLWRRGLVRRPPVRLSAVMSAPTARAGSTTATCASASSSSRL